MLRLGRRLCRCNGISIGNSSIGNSGRISGSSGSSSSSSSTNSRIGRSSYRSSSSSSSSSSGSPCNSNSNSSGGGGGGSRTRGPVTFASLAITAAAGVGLLTYYQLEKEKKISQVASEVVSTGKAALGGPWVLVNQDGVPKTDACFRGQYMLLYFGFTYCPDICPSELVKIGKVMDELKAKKITNIKPVFISVDPARDTVGQMKFYAKDFHPAFEFLTGTKDQVAAATRAFRVYFSKANEQADDEEDYLVDHSIVFYFLAPDGTFLEFFTQRAQIGDIVDKIAGHVKK
jgi:protein SCO1/2